MLIIGLTGGIASGKTTVARILEQQGAHVIDLDLLSRWAVEPGKPAWREIVSLFGEGVLRADRTLDREALGRIVFQDPESRRELERIVHPRVLQEQARLSQEIRRRDPHAIVIVDVPLLIELGLQEKMDAVILVHVPREVQRERLILRNGYSPQEADSRLDAQMDIDDKIPHAHFVIDNSGGEERTRTQAAEVMGQLVRMERDGKTAMAPAERV